MTRSAGGVTLVMLRDCDQKFIGIWKVGGLTDWP
jgi:hypothetical protein